MDILTESLKTDTVIHTYNMIWDSYSAYMKLLANRIFVYLVILHLLKNHYYVPANDIQQLSELGKNLFVKSFLS